MKKSNDSFKLLKEVSAPKKPKPPGRKKVYSRWAGLARKELNKTGKVMPEKSEE